MLIALSHSMSHGSNTYLLAASNKFAMAAGHANDGATAYWEEINAADAAAVLGISPSELGKE